MVLAPVPFADPERDPDAPCKLTILFRAALLHPTDPDPGHILAVAQIASGSIHTIRGLLNGLSQIRDYTRQSPHDPGRTEKIPFWLTRKRTTTTGGPARAVHYTLAVRMTPTEWARYARIRVEEMFLPPQVIAEEMTRREALNAFRDLIPRQLELDAPRGADLAEIERKTHASHGTPVPQAAASSITTDRDEALAEASDRPPEAEGEGETETPTFEPDPELDRTLSIPERLALKQAVGVKPLNEDDPDGESDPESLRTLYRIIKLFDAVHHVATPRLSALTVRHDRWIRAQVAPPTPGAEDDQDIPETPAEPAPDGPDARPPAATATPAEAPAVVEALWSEHPADGAEVEPEHPADGTGAEPES
jgi:hypothetical protein